VCALTLCSTKGRASTSSLGTPKTGAGVCAGSAASDLCCLKKAMRLAGLCVAMANTCSNKFRMRVVCVGHMVSCRAADKLEQHTMLNMCMMTRIKTSQVRLQTGRLCLIHQPHGSKSAHTDTQPTGNKALIFDDGLVFSISL